MNTITIDTALWGLVISQILPIIVGLVTSQLAAGWVKSVVLMFLAAVAAVGQEIVDAGEFQVKAALLKFALLFLAAVGGHYGWLKPAGVTGASGVAGKTLPHGLVGRP